MDIVRIAVLGIVAAIVIIIVKPLKPEIALVAGIGASVLITLMVADELFEVVYGFYDIASATKIDKSIFSNILKIMGVGYLAEFANNICIDGDCKSIGAKIIFAGKIAIMILALPIIKTLVNLIAEILP